MGEPGDDDLPKARKELEEAEGSVLAALSLGIFNGLVRIAGSVGIPLDAGRVGASAAFRGELGLDAFSGARNTDLTGSDRDGFPEGMPELFAG